MVPGALDTIQLIAAARGIDARSVLNRVEAASVVTTDLVTFKDTNRGNNGRMLFSTR
jgi:hypothetical protein